MSEDMGINIGRYGCDSMERWGMDDVCVITFAMFTMSNITKLQIYKFTNSRFSYI